jgi:hypothetical protein
MQLFTVYDLEKRVQGCHGISADLIFQSCCPRS